MRVYYSRTSTYSQHGNRFDLDQKRKEFDAVFFDKGVSGNVSFFDRPQSKKLIALVKKGNVKSIVCNEVSRFARSQVDCANTLKFFIDNGVQVEIEKPALKTHDDNGNVDPMVKAWFGMLSIFSEMEQNFRKQRTKEGVKKYIEKHGKWSSRPIGTVESRDTFLNKPKNKRIQSLLSKGKSVRDIVAILKNDGTPVAPATILKVRRYLK